MIAGKHRFHGQQALRQVYRQGRGFQSEACSLKALRSSHSDYRLAVVISKKVNKLAVKRNRIRRRIYEIVRRHETQLPAGSDIVVTVFSDQLAEVPAAELESLITQLFQQAKLLP